ncbi:hypothetical protein [Aureibaculum conchae]|uniref:hypothetical protein n=1 Tax=Aureibaculum sp. 2308TA14-22 TaxID=3108392 RepID=UPI00339AEED6
MKRVFAITLVLISNFAFAQNKHYYSLEKGGKEYPKIIRFVELGGGEKFLDDSKNIVFNIDNQRFKYFDKKHKIDTCSNFSLQKHKIITIKQLIKDEYEEHLNKTKKEGIKMPPPLNHYNSRVFVIEKINEEKYIKYEVEWIYSIP